MYRIIFLIIALVLEIFMPRRRGFGYRRRISPLRLLRRGLYAYDGYNDGIMGESWAMPVENPNNGVSAQIRASLRRRRALGKCKKFLTKIDYTLTLRNKHVLFVFDTKNKTMTCVDNHHKSRAATVVWSEQLDCGLDHNDNLFEQTFDNICISFNQDSNYVGILKVLKDNFKPVQETLPQAKVQVPPEIEKPIRLDSNREDIYNANLTISANKNSNKVDINNATVEEISKLPGISIIIAKKIVKYRETHGYFKTETEFFREMKIKPYFPKKLSPLIIINSNKSNLNGNNNDERIIDF